VEDKIKGKEWGVTRIPYLLVYKKLQIGRCSPTYLSLKTHTNESYSYVSSVWLLVLLKRFERPDTDPLA